MAVGGIIQDIDEKFLQCYICLDQLKVPKLLPCGHHYCRDCLHRTVPTQDSGIQCPTCRKTSKLPSDGIDGLTTDFNTKNIIDFIKLQNRAEEDADETSSPKEAPRCLNHPGKQLEIFCTTCDKVPICVLCISVSHKGHDLQDTTSLAKMEREKLEQKIEGLMRHKEKIYNKQEELRYTKEKLVSETKKKEELEQRAEMMKRQMSDGDARLQEQKGDFEAKLKIEMSPRKMELERELKQAQARYDAICEEERTTIASEFKRLNEENEKEKAKLQQELEQTNTGIKEASASLHTLKAIPSEEIGKLSEQLDGVVKKFEYLTTTASSILAAKHDWSDVQCVPSVCVDIDSLTEQLEKEFLKSEKSPKVSAASKPSENPTGELYVNINLNNWDEIVFIEGMDSRYSCVNDITCNKDGCIVVTGEASCNRSHITVTNLEGARVRQKILKYRCGCQMHSQRRRFCAFLSVDVVATVCQDHEVGVYNIENGSYRKINMCDIFHAWPVGHQVSCVTTDPVKAHILVGCLDSKKVYVFNDQLVYLHGLVLPEKPGHLRCMSVHKGNLLMCDSDDGKAVTMERPRCKLLKKFQEHNRPCSVCTDKNGFTYILGAHDFGAATLNQYGPNDHTLRWTRYLDNEARCMTTMETQQSQEKIVLVTETGELIIYSLNQSFKIL